MKVAKDSKNGFESRKVLVVEDDPLLRSLIADGLSGSGFNVEIASNALEAKQAILNFDPDVALLDIELGAGPTGLDVAEYIMQQKPHIAILMLTHLPDPRFAGEDSKSIPKRAAYIRKETITQPGVLVDIVESILRDEVHSGLRHDLDPDRPLGGLTKSQISVLRSIALGFSNQEIAEQRDSTIRAVEHLIRRTLISVGIEGDPTVSTRTAAARAYIEAAGLPIENA
jgi:DNA-binding NarL/FixJ family response regulator